MVVEEVATVVQEESSDGLKPYCSREIARTLERPVRTVHKILQNILHCLPYKISHVQELSTSDLPAGETFSLEFLARMEVDNESAWNILWSHEAHFHLTGYVNTQNYRISATRNPFETQPVPLHFAKVTVWCGFTVSFNT
ncbi:uncharacterized protein TNCV_4845331 [Trichonephila clavipes]|uniref:Uncharacterized protein n=1 Tax=Trichonephila clavipes TaxID=2585209 RepID=A0A8X6WLY9_TRICX|nr:uncharacterized protein TNCV_4845331 [Trichonephila clavipes]